MSLPSRRLRAAAPAAIAVVALAAPVLAAVPAAASTTANEIAYTADDNGDGVYSVVLRDLASRSGSVVLPATREEWIYDDPELSPTGDRLALSTDRGTPTDKPTEGIAVVNRNGTGFRLLTSPTAPTGVTVADVGASWSPDATTLLFTRITVDDRDPEHPEESTALYTVPVAGGAATALPGGAGGYTADYSPDGSEIVFAELAAVPPGTEAPDSGKITVIKKDGTGKRLLGPSGLMPSWSPDGTTIAFAKVTDRDSNTGRAWDSTRIATVPAAGGAETVFARTRPSTAPSVAEYPSWTPDGLSIVYDVFGYSATDEFPPGDLWAIDRQGVRAGRVTATRGDEAQVSVQGPKPGSVTAGTASTFTPVTPQRVLDTRSGLGAAKAGKVGPGATLRLAVRDLDTSKGKVPANASAVVLNVTLEAPSSGTDVRVYPSGGALPNASNVNVGRGGRVANLVTAAIGSDGSVTLRNSAGSVHLIADIAGYYTPGDAGSRYGALVPGRILDTRYGQGAPSRKLGQGGTLDLQVTGTLGTRGGSTRTVPANATAVVLNVTGTQPSKSTDVRLYPTGSATPRVSNLNLAAGQTAPNLVTVAIGAGGKVRLLNSSGELHLIADIAGYYAPAQTGATSRFVAVTPTRFLDTRAGIGGAPIATSGNGYVDLKVGGTRGVPSGTTAAVINMTGTGVEGGTDVRAYPANATQPEVSNLNLSRGTTRANLGIVALSPTGTMRLFNGGGSTQLIGDLAGYMVG